jgi:hypothetical protein
VTSAPSSTGPRFPDDRRCVEVAARPLIRARRAPT